jgi:HSP20 family protein
MPLPSVLDEIDRLFDELVRGPWGAVSRRLVPAHFREVSDGWVVELPVEGLRAADLRIEVQGRRLTVSGSRRSEQTQAQAGRTMQSNREVMLRRTLTLPDGADPDTVEAAVEDSVLSIHVKRRRR